MITLIANNTIYDELPIIIFSYFSSIIILSKLSYIKFLIVVIIQRNNLSNIRVGKFMFDD